MNINEFKRLFIARFIEDVMQCIVVETYRLLGGSHASIFRVYYLAFITYRIFEKISVVNAVC
jgi:hypothetical protein